MGPYILLGQSLGRFARSVVKKQGEKMEVSEDIVFNIITDWRKKNISPVKRARFIKAYLEVKSLSIRGLAKDLDMPKSTVDDWLLWDRLSEKQYKQLLANGIQQTDIYRSLRSNRKEDKKLYTDFDILLDKVINRMRTSFEINAKTIERATRLKLLLNDVVLRK